MQKNTKQAAAVAGAVVSLAALTAAGYFIFGPNGKNNRKQIKGWTLKLKGDVLERLEKLRDVTPEVYNDIIDDVAVKYSKLKSIDAAELALIVADLKKHWSAISRDIRANEAGKAKKVAKKKTGAKKASTKKSASKKAASSQEETAS